MAFHYADTLRKHNRVGAGIYSIIYHVAPTIVVKTVHPDLTPEEKATLEEHILIKEIAFFKGLNKLQDRCPDIVECFLMLPDYLFLPYCTHGSLGTRLFHHQEREPTIDRWVGRVIRVKEYEDPALVARWIQQLTSALEYVEKIGFCHNDLHSGNCLLDSNLNLKLTDFGCATTIGQLLENLHAPRAMKILAGPLKGTYGLCSARTEQFAVGTLLYLMLYGYEPYDDIDSREWVESGGPDRFANMEFPELNCNEVLDGLISACWHNVYPTMAFVAYDFKRKTKDMVLSPEYIPIDSVKEIKACEALIRKGLLGPELALRFQPAWRRYLHAFMQRGMFIWQSFLQRRFWIWS
ncbi:uncharacterized protein N7518_006295 [Penicillium psychrosexuale]|uniref:uncharacterized protein n=1 Tax=Penicillium psychrosexuale TaxID=1002107 RepID=UPI00254554B9|nr:uncharacterized protein N7518_006295 [Penicillium psychrosexuale]KAJ5789284.1 hypothetical protein N7518_006295 [Penicillium psychrosexuale]